MSPYDLRFRTALDAAERVFARKGYGSASIRDIARSAGISVAGLYYYLPSKQQALHWACARAFRAMDERLDRALAGASTPDEQLRAFIRGHLEFVVEHADAFHVMLHDMDSLEGQARAEVAELRRRYFARAADLVIAVQQQERSPVSTRIATAALFGMMNWTPMWRHGAEVDAAGIADQMHRLFLRGVATPQTLTEAEVVA